MDVAARPTRPHWMPLRLVTGAMLLPQDLGSVARNLWSESSVSQMVDVLVSDLFDIMGRPGCEPRQKACAQVITYYDAPLQAGIQPSWSDQNGPSGRSGKAGVSLSELLDCRSKRLLPSCSCPCSCYCYCSWWWQSSMIGAQCTCQRHLPKCSCDFFCCSTHLRRPDGPGSAIEMRGWGSLTGRRPRDVVLQP